MLVSVILAVIIILILALAYVKYKIIADELKLWSNNDKVIDCADNVDASCGSILTAYRGDKVDINIFAISITAAFIRGIYANEITFDNPVVSFDVIYSHIDENIPFACVCRLADDSTCIIFRGTLTAEDFDYDIDSLQTNSGGDDHRLGKVHSGMYEVYKSLKNKLQYAIKNLPNKRFILCGHSLGAALAIYMSSDLPPGAQVIAIAPPRSGDLNFAQNAARHANITSIINLADMVPTIPWSYVPSDKLYGTQYAHVGKVILFNILGVNILNCHALVSYYEGILELLQ